MMNDATETETLVDAVDQGLPRDEAAKSGSVHSKTCIVTGTDERIAEAGRELSHYLSKTYPDESFDVVHEKVPGRRAIVLEISEEAGLTQNEAFHISGDGQNLFIRGRNPRALFHGVYGLLKHVGWHFHLSFELPPGRPEPLNFSEINVQNAPLKQRRILFNWHNFLSGCTGWDLEQWEQWIDHSSKIGFNSIMVHAYGNNPMHSFSFNGQEKELGNLTSSQRGRDWGTQHVNDVRLLHGGRVFSTAEFGPQAAKVPEHERAQAATQLMQNVFQHAQRKAMEVCFALDVDTWMASPQNILKTLPCEALIPVGGYDTVNPEHPEGRRYYQAQIKHLFSDYPEISVLTLWMRCPIRGPGQRGSVWLLHTSSTLPETWREEYLHILGQHPDLEDKHPYPGLFAVSKIVRIFRELLDETNPDVELTLGSWYTDYMKMADPFIPPYCGFVPLDGRNLLRTDEVYQNVKEVGKNRKIYPIVWAHHDDHRYIGRPYVPYAGLNELLDGIHASGYGVIHWITHPFDPFFANHENQVWQNTENETWEQTVAAFSESLLKAEEPNLNRYFQLWFNQAPMFGRETSDHFLVLEEEYNLEGYASSMEVVGKARERLAVLEDIHPEALNAQGVKEYSYQMGMEKFIISFFTNHHHAYSTVNAMKKEDFTMGEVLSMASRLNAEETIEIFSKAIGEYGPTRGEEGLLISLNMRWLPDYIDLRQRTGLEPVRISFQSTSHDPLAQGPGSHTFFVDGERHFWLSLGEKALGCPCETNGQWPLKDVTDSWLMVSRDATIPLKTMRGHTLAALNYEIQILFGAESSGCRLQVLEDHRVISEFSTDAVAETVFSSFKASGNEVSLKIIPTDGAVKLAGMQIRPA